MANLEPRAFDGMELSVVAIPLKGDPGGQGEPGLRGDPGKSNYQLWLDAGNTGTLEEFLESIKGEPGQRGAGLRNRGEWQQGVYEPGDFVVAEGENTSSSLWFLLGEDSFISNVPPHEEIQGVWIETPVPGGADGSVWFIEETDPTNDIGMNGDAYLNIMTGDVFGPKTGGDWGPARGNLKGADATVTSVNGKTGAVNLTAEDVGALPPGANVSELNNDAGYITEADIPESPVISVNGKTGLVVISAADLNALTANDVAPVAMSGAYGDLIDLPTLGTAAAQNVSYFLLTSMLGAINGVAPLGTDAKIPAAYLPSYVDDVLEFTNLAAFPAVGETGKIYVALNTNIIYRWSGTQYIVISASPGSTDAVPEGSVNLYHTTERARAAAPVQSVNGSTGAVSVTPANINAQPLNEQLTQFAAQSPVANRSTYHNGTQWQLYTLSVAGRALANATGANGGIPYFNGANTYGEIPSLAFGRGILNNSTQAATKSYLGLPITVATTAPTSPTVGDVWIDIS